MSVVRLAVGIQIMLLYPHHQRTIERLNEQVPERFQLPSVAYRRLAGQGLRP